MSNRLMSYLPPLYHDIAEFEELMNAQQPEIDSVKSTVDRLLDNQFVLTANEAAIKRREKILSIQADPKTETLSFRRKRIINRQSTKPPFTIRFLQQRLDFLVGPDRAITSVDSQRYILKVTASIDDASVFKEVERTVKAIIPANLIYHQETAVDDKIVINESITAQPLARQTRLSTSWKLGKVPFAVAGQEVVIK